MSYNLRVEESSDWLGYTTGGHFTIVKEGQRENWHVNVDRSGWYEIKHKTEAQIGREFAKKGSVHKEFMKINDIQAASIGSYILDYKPSGNPPAWFQDLKTPFEHFLKLLVDN